MYIAFFLFLSCTIGRIQIRPSEEGIHVQRVNYTGSQIGLEQQLKQRINYTIRQEGWYGRTPIVLDLIWVQEKWQSSPLWVLEAKASVTFQDKKSPEIRYRYVESVESLERFPDIRQEAYQKMYFTLAQRILHWIFLQRKEA